MPVRSARRGVNPGLTPVRSTGSLGLGVDDRRQTSDGVECRRMHSALRTCECKYD